QHAVLAERESDVGDPLQLARRRAWGGTHVLEADHERELAAEHGLVELEGLQGVAVEVEVGIHGVHRHVSPLASRCATFVVAPAPAAPPLVERADPKSTTRVARDGSELPATRGRSLGMAVEAAEREPGRGGPAEG